MENCECRRLITGPCHPNFQLRSLCDKAVGVDPKATGRPSYHPSVLLKLYIYGYLNRVQSSRRLEREAGRNVEVMWLTGRLVPDHKTIADFRKDNGAAIRKVCARFVALCRQFGLLAEASVAVDGSKFKAVSRHQILESAFALITSAQDPEAVGFDPLGWARATRMDRPSSEALAKAFQPCFDPLAVHTKVALSVNGATVNRECGF